LQYHLGQRTAIAGFYNSWLFVDTEHLDGLLPETDVRHAALSRDMAAATF